mgnify:FL=1
MDIRKPFQNHSSLRVFRIDIMLALLATVFSMARYKIVMQDVLFGITVEYPTLRPRKTNILVISFDWFP